MKKLYSIGDTAKIMGVSVQTLRNYSNTALLKPTYINEENGYRYFSFEQFHTIDRIKYLRSLGLSLHMIEDIVNDGSIDSILEALEKQRIKTEEEIERLKNIRVDIDWYISYFKYQYQKNIFMLPHVTFHAERYCLYTDICKEDTIEDIEIRLAKKKTELELAGAVYYRQYGYVLGYEDIKQAIWRPEQYYIFVEKKPDCEKNDIMVIPEGYYLCMKFRLRHLEDIDFEILNKYFSDIQTSQVVLANEYEDNLNKYHNCPYELQILIE